MVHLSEVWPPLPPLRSLKPLPCAQAPGLRTAAGSARAGRTVRIRRRRVRSNAKVSRFHQVEFGPKSVVRVEVLQCQQDRG